MCAEAVCLCVRLKCCWQHLHWLLKMLLAISSLMCVWLLNTHIYEDKQWNRLNFAILSRLEKAQMKRAWVKIFIKMPEVNPQSKSMAANEQSMLTLRTWEIAEKRRKANKDQILSAIIWCALEMWEVSELCVL